MLGEIHEDAEWLVGMVENLLTVTRVDGAVGANLNKVPEADVYKRQPQSDVQRGGQMAAAHMYNIMWRGSMNVFDIVGPVMIGPSSSHTAGAARIGPVSYTHLDVYKRQVFLCG